MPFISRLKAFKFLLPNFFTNSKPTQFEYLFQILNLSIDAPDLQSDIYNVKQKFTIIILVILQKEISLKYLKLRIVANKIINENYKRGLIKGSV